MKYCILICDGMADYKCDSLGGKTPMEAAHKPVMDALVQKSTAGTVSNVPVGMVPESDTANLAILSYDPAIYSKGRSPLEAAAMGLEMKPTETAFRCNLVTLSEKSEKSEVYERLSMIDHSSDEITTKEADGLVSALNQALGNDDFHIYTGVSYRHCLLWNNAPENGDFMRPHDILGKKISPYLPPEPFLSLHKKSREILENHPINKARRERGLRPANSIWLWSPGKKPSLPSFKEKWGLEATVVAAVDLIKGIGFCASMKIAAVEGATGNLRTNYEGKAEAAINALKAGDDLVYIHVEAPDECGHRAELENKVKAIEYIDSRILRHIADYLSGCGEDYRVMVLPDHPTPVSLRTHTGEPVPFFIYSNINQKDGTEGAASFTEELCAKTGLYVPRGFELLDLLIKKQ